MLALTLPVRAGDIDNPEADQARVLLEKVWNPDTPLTNADQTKLLQQALADLKRAPRNYGGVKRKVMHAIESALDELGRGDPDNRAHEDVHAAVDLIRDMT